MKDERNIGDSVLKSRSEPEQCFKLPGMTRSRWSIRYAEANIARCALISVFVYTENASGNGFEQEAADQRRFAQKVGRKWKNDAGKAHLYNRKHVSSF
jgi:hypothetical protein